MARPLVPSARTYDNAVAACRWRIPQRFTIGIACSDGQAADDPAVIEYDAGRRHRVRTFAELAEASNRIASSLVALGVAPRARVGLLVPQSLTTALGSSRFTAAASSPTVPRRAEQREEPAVARRAGLTNTSALGTPPSPVLEAMHVEQ